MDKLSTNLSILLLQVEKEIHRYIEENKFYLDFENKGWASCSQGQILIYLTMMATNLKQDIETFKKHGL